MATKKKLKTKNTKGQAMRKARRHLGWTQLDLARRVGCTESLVTKIETGRAMPERELKEATIANGTEHPRPGRSGV